ncbi:MAG: hypothetical protein WBO95_07285 [Candidatus Dechloromonas phosphoritropha]|jgi:hypothetical protein|nr:hypothetical protein [Azonexus sp.]
MNSPPQINAAPAITLSIIRLSPGLTALAGGIGREVDDNHGDPQNHLPFARQSFRVFDEPKWVKDISIRSRKPGPKESE